MVCTLGGSNLATNMGRKKGRTTEPVRIDKETVQAVREYANANEILIGGFFSLAETEKI